MKLLRKRAAGHIEGELLTQDLVTLTLVRRGGEKLTEDADAIDHRRQHASAARHGDGDFGYLTSVLFSRRLDTARV
jgi:hypothetical protein